MRAMQLIVCRSSTAILWLLCGCSQAKYFTSSSSVRVSRCVVVPFENFGISASDAGFTGMAPFRLAASRMLAMSCFK